jgi:tRNA (mo5U34)-methyltransferase
MVNSDELRKEVAKITWWHRIDLGHGVVTPGVDDTPEKLKTLGFPEDLTGMTVLDIGAWDGFFSFEAERRGADRVLAIDSCYRDGESWQTNSGFDLAHRVLNSKVEHREMDVLDVSPEEIGRFDLVLFLGVLYHMRHPLLALEKVFSVTGKQLILETHADMLLHNRPAMAFYPEKELENDPTNWCGPNSAAVKAMLKSVGFRKVEVVSGKSLLFRLGRAVKWRIQHVKPFMDTVQRDRMVFHARR